MELEKIVVVKKATRLEELLKRHATDSQVKFYLESRGESYGFYKNEHTAYIAGLQIVVGSIPNNVRSQIIDRELLSTFQFSGKDVVVVVGDPGLFVNVAKYVGEQPVIVANPDKERIDDVFTSCYADGFSQLMKKTLEGKIKIEKLTMAEARLDDGQVMYALNDLFIGKDSHVSARYEISHLDRTEKQSSSGIIVSTGTGSTGWRTSVMVGANAIAGVDYDGKNAVFPRDADYLEFVVREPFPSKVTGTKIVYGKITKATPLKISSNMPTNGVIFSDGIEQDYIEFNAGRTATIRPSEKKVYLVKG